MPVLAFLLGFVLLSLLDVWSHLPALVHLLVFVCLLVAVLWGLLSAVGAFLRPRSAGPVHWVRYILLLPLLVMALFVAGQDWERRLVVAFRPGLLFPPPHMRILATITPPAYARLAQIALPVAKDAAKTPFKVPAGSILRVEVRDARWAPLLAWGREAVVLRPEKDGSYAIEGELKADGKVRVAFAGKTLAAWLVDVMPDHAPAIRYTAKPGESARHSLRLAIDARDDHGIEYLALRMRRADGSGVDHVIDLPAYGTPEIRQTIYKDLTADPLAGEEVTLQVVAVDGLSQEASTKPVTLRLPKRQFRNALALALVAVRSGLLGGEFEDVEQAIRRLGALSEQAAAPVDATVHLGLRTAYLRLRAARSEEDRREVSKLLWDLALRAEDGGLSITGNELAEALGDVQMILRRHGSPEQLQGALGSLAAAFENYGQVRAPAAGSSYSKDPDAIDWGAVQAMLTRFNDLAAAGDHALLADEIVTLRTAFEERPEQVFSANAYRQFMVASYGRHLMDELLRQQQQLVTRAAALAIGEKTSGEQPAAHRAMAVDQAALRDALSALIIQLDRAGMADLGAFSHARLVMDQAVDILSSGPAAESAEIQPRVLEALQAASKVLAAVPPPVLPDADGNYQDPLGRPLPPGFGDAGSGSAGQ